MGDSNGLTRWPTFSGCGAAIERQTWDVGLSENRRIAPMENGRYGETYHLDPSGNSIIAMENG